jgi:hypothetical protein
MNGISDALLVKPEPRGGSWGDLGMGFEIRASLHW